MNDLVPIREYEEAVYIYWYGPTLPTVKIGHSNDPDKRLSQLGNDTGVPDHLASFAAIVWLDRKREKVEALAHAMAASFRKSGEWFALLPQEALAYVISAAKELNIRYEVEDRAGLLPSSKELLRLQELKKIADEELREEEEEENAKKAARVRVESERERYGECVWGSNWRNREAEVIAAKKDLLDAEEIAKRASIKVRHTEAMVSEGQKNAIHDTFLKARRTNAYAAKEDDRIAQIRLEAARSAVRLAQGGLTAEHRKVIEKVLSTYIENESQDDENYVHSHSGE